MPESQEFDIDAGVDSIAADMGWEQEEEKESKETEQHEDAGEPEQEEKQAPEVEAKKAPASWSKDQHENWAKVPKEAQDYIELREKQMLDGIEQYKQGAQFAGELQKIIEPFKPMIEQFGVDEKTAIHNLFSWNQKLTNGPVESRQDAFVKLGQDLGIIPKEGQAAIDPHTQELQQRLDRIERQEQERLQVTQKEHYEQTAKEVEAFANDPANEHFELVVEDILEQLKTGVDLKTAYDRAVWANQVTRAKEIAKATAAQNKELTAKQKAEAAAAKKASSTNVKQVQTNKTVKEPIGSWEDTMQQVLKERQH